MGWSLGVVWGPCPLLPTFCFIDHLRYWGGADRSCKEGTGSYFLGLWGCVWQATLPRSLAWSEAGFGWP